MSKRPYSSLFSDAAVGAIGASAVAGLRSVGRYVSGSKKKMVSNSTGGVRFSRSKHRIGRARRRSVKAVFKAVLGIGTPAVSRWQNISETLAGPGRLPIGYLANAADSDNEVVPLMMMSLTNLGGVLGTASLTDNSAKGAYQHGMIRFRHNRLNDSFDWYKWGSQQYSSVNDFSPDVGYFQGEQNQVSATFGPKKFFHKFTDIRLNLYSSQLYLLTYNVYVVQLPKMLDPYQYTSGTAIAAGAPLNAMLKDITRPLIKNPINMNGRVLWPKQCRIIRKYSYDMPALQSGNVIVNTETLQRKTSNVNQVRIFLRHDRYRNYSWTEQAANTVEDPVLTDLGWDVTQVGEVIPDVEWGKRLFLIVTCTTGEKYLDTGAGHAATAYSNINLPNNGIPQTYQTGDTFPYSVYNGSVDVMVRNSYIISPLAI